MKTPIDVGPALKRMLKEQGIAQEEAAQRAGIGIRQLQRILKGTTRLTVELATSLCTACGLKDSEQLLALVRASHNKGFRAPQALKAFGAFIAAKRMSIGKTVLELAAECSLKQPNLSNIETGKAAPNPLTATRIATKLMLSPMETAEFFRLLSNALLASSAVKFTSCPPLVSLMEWTTLQHSLSADGVVGEDLPAGVAGKLKTAISSAARSLDQGGKHVPYAVIQKSDGSAALVVPIIINL